MPIWIKYIWKETNLVFCTLLTIFINTIVYLVTIFCLSDKLITHASFVCGIVSAICSFIIMLMAFRTNAKIKSKIAILNLKHRFENLQKIPMSGGYLAEQEALCLKDDLETTRRLHKDLDDMVKLQISNLISLIENRGKDPLYYERVCNHLQWITDINTVL